MKYLETISVPIDEPVDFPGNARVHNDDWLDRTVSPGQHQSILVRRLPDGSLQILGGHGTRNALRRRGDAEIRCEVHEASDAEALQANLSLNPPPGIGGFDNALLTALLEQANDFGVLDTSGWDDATLKRLLERSDDLPDLEDTDGEEEDEEPSKGDLLALAGVTIGEPEIQVSTGEVWRLGAHTLVVADVHSEWSHWAEYLLGDTLLWPYPSLLAPFTRKALEHPVLMVQPDHYLAGWVLTKWKWITGSEPVKVRS